MIVYQTKTITARKHVMAVSRAQGEEQAEEAVQVEGGRQVLPARETTVAAVNVLRIMLSFRSNMTTEDSAHACNQAKPNRETWSATQTHS